MTIDHHSLAAISVTGCCLDVIGSLYLAYDLLGGQYGPLRLLTRAVTYSIFFGVGYGLGLGLLFGIAAGASTGITIAVELHRVARGFQHYSLAWESFFSLVRSTGFAIALEPLMGLRFAIAFAVITTLGQINAYTRGMRPGIDYSAERRPRITPRQFWGTIVRLGGYTATAVLCSLLFHRIGHVWLFSLRIGVVTGMVTGVGILLTPFVEYYADNLPERRLGVFGIGLILCGFAMQSMQYWFALFDVRLT
jgi:hypothetical protein